MKLHFYTIPKTGNISISFDNLKSWKVFNVEDIISSDGKLKINRNVCSDLNSIYIKLNDGTLVKPDVKDDSWQYYFYIETTNTVYKSLGELEQFLKSSPINSPDKPIELHTYNLQKNLARLSEIISDSKRYVDISFTILKHDDIYNSFTDNWVGLENYIDKGKEIHSFPSVFKNNVYITGITIPKQDNYSEPNVLTGCKNLKRIQFENGKNWKAEKDLDYYELNKTSVNGTSAVDISTFIDKLVNSSGTTNSFLMESEGLW